MDLKDLVLQTLDEVAQDSGAGDSGHEVDIDSGSIDFGNADSGNADFDSVDSGSEGAQELGRSGKIRHRSQAHADPQAAPQTDAQSSPKSPPHSRHSADAKHSHASGLDSSKAARLDSSTSKPKLPKTSIESSPAKAGKIISKAQAEASLSRDHQVLLEDLREKLLVLFEGLKTPELQDTSKKLDLVIRFLQYQLCIIDEILGRADSN